MSSLYGDWGVLAFVLAGALVGGFVNGLTGFGTGLTALPFWLQAVEPLLCGPTRLPRRPSSAISPCCRHLALHADWRRLPHADCWLIRAEAGTWVLLRSAWLRSSRGLAAC
jgi:hypothetical protein